MEGEDREAHAGDVTMKKLLLSLACFIASAAFFFGCQSKEKNASQLVVGTNPTYFPFEFKNEKGELDGFDIDLAKALGKQLGKKVVFQELDFDGLILGLKQGKINLILSGMSMTPSREQEIAMVPYQNEPITELYLSFWERIPQGIRSLKDIKGCVAVQVGTFQADYLTEEQNVCPKLLESNTDLLIDIKYGKSTAALFEPYVARALKLKFPQLRLLPTPLPKEHWAQGYAVGIKKENQELYSQVSSGLKRIDLKPLETQWFGGAQ